MRRYGVSVLIVVLFAVALALPVLYLGSGEEEHYEYPPLIMVEGALYGSAEQQIPDPAQTPEYLGKVRTETARTEKPQQDLEANFPNCIGSEVYRLDQDAVLVKYSKNFGVYWEKFSKILENTE